VSWLDDDLNTTLDSSIANVNSIELLRERERGGGDKWKYFYITAPTSERRLLFWKVPILRPFVLLIRSLFRETRVWRIGGCY